MLRLLGAILDLYKSTDSLASSIALSCKHATVTLSYAQRSVCSRPMKVLAPTTASFDFAVPDWLQSCLNAPPSDSEPVPDRSSVDAALICRAFEFAYELHQGQYRPRTLYLSSSCLPVYYEIWGQQCHDSRWVST